MKKIFFILLSLLIFSLNVSAKDLRFVQITDVKYTKKAETNILKDAIKEINKQKDIDFVVFTGNNILKPNPTDLEFFVKEVKKLRKPVFIIIGDRDVNKYKEMSKKQYITYLKKHMRNFNYNNFNYTFEKKGVVFFVVDGSKDVIPSTNGYFKEDVLEWVDANLDLNKKKNVVILQHYPLIPPTKNENYYTLKAEKYLDIINKHKNVKAVIAGHFGVNKEETVNGVVHISTGALPNYRVIDIIDCNSDNPTFWAEVRQVSSKTKK